MADLFSPDNPWSQRYKDALDADEDADLVKGLRNRALDWEETQGFAKLPPKAKAGIDPSAAAENQAQVKNYDSLIADREADRGIAQQNADTARRNADFAQEKYWQDRADTLERDAAEMSYKRDALAQSDAASAAVTGENSRQFDVTEAGRAEQRQYDRERDPASAIHKAFTLRGEAPPGEGVGKAAGLPHLGSSTSATRDLSNWRNMSIPTILATFSATELARLPLEALAQFSNEEKLRIGEQYPGGVDAFLGQFPEDVLNTFGQDVQDRARAARGTNPATTASVPPLPGTAPAAPALPPAAEGETFNPQTGRNEPMFGEARPAPAYADLIKQGWTTDPQTGALMQPATASVQRNPALPSAGPSLGPSKGAWGSDQPGYKPNPADPNGRWIPGVAATSTAPNASKPSSKTTLPPLTASEVKNNPFTGPGIRAELFDPQKRKPASMALPPINVQGQANLLPSERDELAATYLATGTDPRDAFEHGRRLTTTTAAGTPSRGRLPGRSSRYKGI